MEERAPIYKAVADVEIATDAAPHVPRGVAHSAAPEEKRHYADPCVQRR